MIQRSGHKSQHRKKETTEEKVQKHLLSSFQKTKSKQTSGSVFADRIEQNKKTEIELELINFVDYFVDGRIKCTGNLVTFKIEALESNQFVNPKETCNFE